MSDLQSTFDASSITPYGYVNDGKVFLKGYLGGEDREIGVVRDGEEASIQYFVERYNTIKAKILIIEENVKEAENKGSYLMKLIHMRSQLDSYNGLGDFEYLLDIILSLEEEIKVYISGNRVKNKEIKEALLLETQEIDLEAIQDWKEATEVIKELKLKWIKTGSAPKELDEEYNQRFSNMVEHYFKYRRQTISENTKKARERFNSYRELLQDIKLINQKGGGADAKAHVAKLQEDWKEVGRIPKKKYAKVSFEFKKEVETYLSFLVYQDPDPEEFGPLERKKIMLDGAQKIQNGELKFNLSAVKKIQLAWKEIGKLQDIEDRNLNLNFRITCNELFESYFLDRAMKEKFPEFRTFPKTEQFSHKIDHLEEVIGEESEELNEFSRNNAEELKYRNPNQFSPIHQQRGNMVNKIKTKQRILEKLEEKLEELEEHLRQKEDEGKSGADSQPQ